MTRAELLFVIEQQIEVATARRAEILRWIDRAVADLHRIMRGETVVEDVAVDLSSHAAAFAEVDSRLRGLVDAYQRIKGLT